MISRKLVITYKRKRLSSTFQLAQGIEGTKASPACPRSAWSNFGPKAETSAGLSSKKRKGDGKKHSPHGKPVCSGCNDKHDSVKSVPQQVQEPRTGRENKRIDGSEMGPITLRSRKVLLVTNPGDKISSKGKNHSPNTDASAEMKSGSVQIGLSSGMNSGSGCKVEQMEGFAGSQVLLMDDTQFSISEFADSSIERKCNTLCLDSALKTCNSGNSDSSLEANFNLLPSDVLPKRFSKPLITFSRRARKKEYVDSADIQTKSDTGNQFSLMKVRSCGIGASRSDEGSSRKCNSPDQPTSFVMLREDPEMTPFLLCRIDETVHNKVDDGSESSYGGGALATEIAVHHAAQGTNANIGKASRIAISNAMTKSDEITRPSDSSEHLGFQDDLKRSETPPAAHCISDLNVQISVNSPITSDLFPSNVKPLHGKTNSPELSRCKQSVDVVSSPEDAIVLHETANEESTRLEFGEIPGETAQETLHHQKRNGENFFSSFDEVNMNYKQEVDKKTSFVPLRDAHVQDPCHQDLSGEIVNEAVPLAYISGEATSSLSFLGRTYLPQSRFEKDMCKQTPSKSSFCPPHFLGLSLPTKPAAVKGSQSTMSETSYSIKSCHDYQLGLHDPLLPSASEYNPSLVRHKQLLENIVTRAEMLRRSQACSLEKFKGHANTWSEEELDNLWIGVRRHGRGNWDAMLRDPRLHFAEWRVAEDLASRWDEEQSGLLSGTLSRPMVLSKADNFSAVSSSCLPRPAIGSRYSGSADEHHMLRYPTLATETELSLGDVYIQKEANVRKRYPFHLPGPALALPLSRNDGPDISPYLINGLRMGDKQQKPMKAQRIRSYSGRKRGRYDKGFPALQQKPIDNTAGHVQWSREMFTYGRNIATLNDSLSSHDLPTSLPATGNLPHWLREVFTTSQRPTEPALPLGVSAIAHSVSVLYNEKPVIPPFPVPGVAPMPPKDPRQQGLRKSSVCSKAAGLSGLRSPTMPMSAMPTAASCSSVMLMETQLDQLRRPGPSSLIPSLENQVLDKKTTTDLNQPLPDPSNDLIVVDSEASSEETISDDRSGGT